MRILHLSDIHFDVSKKSKFNELIKELKKTIRNIDLIVITGDLINRGNAGCESADKGFEIFDSFFLDPILLHFKLENSHDKVILVPGNHDVDRKKSDRVINDGLRLNCIDENYVSKIIQQGLDENSYMGCEILEAYKTYVLKFYEKCSNSNITLFHDTHIINIDGVDIGITSFNTAWRCYDSESDKGNLILGVEQCLQGAEAIEKCKIKIALMHHELSFLQQADREKIEPRIKKVYDIVCYGHVHSGECSQHCSVSGEHINFISPGFCTENMFTKNYKYEIGFSIIDIDTKDGMVDVAYYKWSQDRTTFVRNHDLGLANPIQLINYKPKKYFISENAIIERSCDNERIFSSNDKLVNEKIGISEIINNQDKVILVETKGILHSNAKNITDILGKIEDYKKFISESEFVLLYADKIIYNNAELYSKFDRILINNVILTDKVINASALEEVIELLEYWLNILLELCNKSLKVNILQTLEACRIYGDAFEIEVIEQIIVDRKNINGIVEEYSEIKKKQMILASFILPIFNISSSKILYFEENEENDDIISDYIDREINEQTYELFLENQNTVLYGKIGLGKTTSVKRIKNKLDESNKLQICIYYSFLHQTIQENMSSFLECCNNRLLLKVINDRGYDADVEEICIKLLTKILDNLLIEYKNVYIIFDNIDNANLGLMKLLLSIKTDCHLLFVVNDKHIQSFKDRGDINFIPYPEKLTVQELVNYNLDSETAASLSDINISDYDLINKITSRDFDNIKDYKDYIEEANKNKNNSYFLEANNWMCEYQIYREEILVLLSIFTKVCPLNIEQIQNYILHQGIYVKKPYIKQIIINFEEQLVHNNYSKIKFKDEDFVEYVFKDYFSQYDMDVVIDKIFKWIAELDISDSYIIAFFVASIRNIEVGRPGLLYDLELNLNKTLFKKGDGKLLFNIGQTIYNEFVEQREFAIKYIEQANENNYVKATEFLIEYYLNKSSEPNNTKAKSLIVKGIENNSEKAKFSYVVGILEEKFISEDDTYDRGMEILYDLSMNAKDKFMRIRSELFYSIYTIKGFDSKIQYSKAIENIKELSKEDDIAKVYYAKYLIDTNVENNINNAESILVKLSDEDSMFAKIELCKLYLSKKAGMFNTQKVIDIFKSMTGEIDKEVDDFILEAYFDDIFTEEESQYINEYIKNKLERNIEEFEISYSLGLLQGEQKYRNIIEGQRYLKKLVANNNVDAMCILGTYLIYNDRNSNAGINLLEKAVQLNSVNAQLTLANLCLDKSNSFFDVNKGLSLYKKLINKGNIEAVLKYSKYILESGTNNIQEKNIAIDRITYLTEVGNVEASKILGRIYLDEASWLYNANKGEYYLSLAAQKGDISSISNLAQRYLYGISIKENILKGVELLKSGIKSNDAFCMALLGRAIIERTVTDLDEAEGKQLLINAYELGDNLAKMYYGYYLCIGNNFKQNKILGEKLLAEAATIYDEAKLILCRMKLDGRYLEKNTEKGLKLLLDAVDNGLEEAKIEYAERLIDADKIEGDITKGLDILRQLMKSNSDNAKIIYAQKLLSQKFGNKELEARNILNNLLCTNKTARRIYSINLLNEKLEKGLEKEKRENKAIRLLQENIDEDDKASFYILGSKYIEGQEITRNVKKGLELFEIGAEKGSTECIRELGIELLSGELVERDSYRGDSLINIACKRGDLKAKYIYAKYNIEDIFLPEPNRNLGWNLMEQLMEDNNLDAKRYMANACIKGSYRDRNIERGIRIFEDLIFEKDEIACIDYSNLLVSGQYLKTDLVKAQKVLQIAINNPEASSAKYIKVQRMYNGKWRNKSIKKAAKELEILASNGYEDARFELAIRQISGDGVAKNEKKGTEVLKSIIKDIKTTSALPLGLIAYRLKAYSYASDLFDIAIKTNTYTCKNSLAYIIRRNHYSGSLFKNSVPELLKPLCDIGFPIALINFVLYLVQGVEDDRVWREADTIIKRIRYYDESFEWWYDLMQEGDDEGRLIIAWLIRNNIYFDNDKSVMFALVKDINKNIWKIPKWFLEVQSE